MESNSSKLILALPGIVLAFAPGAQAASKAIKAQDSQRPNILYIMTDQQRWDALGYSGNKVIKTPNLDRLARSGAYFSHAVTPCPVSGPARCSILTGMTIEKSGVRLNDDTHDKNLPLPYKTFDEMLSADGYYDEYYGKFHSPKAMAEVYRNPSKGGLSGADLILGDKSLYKKLLDREFPDRSLKAGEHLGGGVYAGVPYKPSPMDRRYGMTPQEAKEKKAKVDPHGCVNIPAELSFTSYTVGQALDAMDRVASNAPFAISCSIVAPHAPFLPSEPYCGMYNPKDMPIPATIGDDMKNNPYKKSSAKGEEFRDPKRIGYFISEYYALITEADMWIGKLLDKLDQLGLTENTVVVFTSDHGEMLGDHGMQAKFVFLEGSVRVPLIVSYPGVIPAGKKIDAPVSLTCIYPTILELAGIDNSQSDGYSLMGLIQGQKSKYDFAVSEWTSGKTNVPNIMIRTSDWKLMLSYTDDSGANDALFDMRNDPGEMNNLLGKNPAKSKQKETVSQLQGKLAGYLEDIEHPFAGAVKKRVVVR